MILIELFADGAIEFVVDILHWLVDGPRSCLQALPGSIFSLTNCSAMSSMEASELYILIPAAVLDPSSTLTTQRRYHTISSRMDYQSSALHALVQRSLLPLLPSSLLYSNTEGSIRKHRFPEAQ